MTTEIRTQHPAEQLSPSRFSRLLRSLTSYYAIALAIVIGSIFLFIELADEVLEKEFVNLNTSILLSVHAHASSFLTTLAFTFTDIGSVIGILVIAAIAAFYLWKKKRYVDLATFGAVLAGAGIIMFVFKLIFHQVRPHVFQPLQVETSYSFPSGHSLMSFSVWGFIGWWLITQNPKQLWRWIVAAIGMAVAACVALSRLYLGVHWPTDVIGGMLLAFAWVGACIAGQRWLTRHARREKRLQDAKATRTSHQAT